MVEAATKMEVILTEIEHLESIEKMKFHVCMYVCMYVGNVCMYVCTYIHAYIHNAYHFAYYTFGQNKKLRGGPVLSHDLSNRSETR